MCDAAGAEVWSYDITANVGWKITDARTTNGVTKSTIVQNNLAGSAATVSYPSGRIITYAYDAASRPVSAIDSTGPINYATAATYVPPGGLSSFTNSTSIISTFFYNNRLQPCRISIKFSGTAPSTCTDTSTGNILDFTYNFSVGTADNGNVTAITNNRDTTRSQSFSYDSLNRISTAKTTSTSGATCWDEQFGYDPWGNLLSIGRIAGYTCSNEELLNVSATAKNQVSGETYDAAGNLINDGLGHAYTYNAENQLLTTAGVTYTYDGDGKRVQKSSGTIYWYGISSDPLDETDLTGSITNTAFNEYVFFGGKRVARRDSSNNVYYYLAGHLGTARIVANSSGTVLDDSDFYPFGGERIVSSSSGNRYKFTAKERDAESGLDEFGARYYSSALGRFTIPDWAANATAVPYADFGNPQSLNLYSYVKNNPLNFTDPDGHCCAPYELANYLDTQINSAVNYVQDRAVASGSPALAATATFAAGVTGDVGKGFTNLLRTGESVGSLPDNASGGQIASAIAEEGGRVGGTILAVVAVAGPSTPATAESGAQVASEIGKNRVTLDNGSQVDVAGKSHGGVDTPHIKDPTFNTNPQTGQVFQNKYGPVRPATVGDVNAAAKTAGATPPVRIPPPTPVPQKKDTQ
ncbi:MAG TPA: RHS repeat-associated core domain-containing protein [Candidatus Acidoferrum sp.]|nr:RHS repeat-associated core domain-containing protein [Candidatus Acidoferrum sp.]